MCTVRIGPLRAAASISKPRRTETVHRYHPPSLHAHRSEDPNRSQHGNRARDPELQGAGQVNQYHQPRKPGGRVAEIVLDDVTKVYPDGTQAVSSVDIDIADAEFMV